MAVRDSIDQDLLVLTAGHLFAWDLPDDVRVLWADSPQGPWRPLGQLKRRAPQQRQSPVSVDAAVIRPFETVQLVEARGKGVNPLGSRNLWVPPPESEVAVSKRGATTGLTKGLLEPVDAKHLDQHGDTYNLGWWVLGDDQRFAGPGDSGAIVVDEEHRAVGMAVLIDSEEDSRDVQCLVHGIDQILAAMTVEMLESKTGTEPR